MKQIKLDAEEKKIMKAIENNEYVPVGGKELRDVADAIAARKKNMTLTIRVNSQDINRIKRFSKSKGIPYQTYLSEVIHRVAATV
jgi:predicted DNA binding CopG/RHH family protein